MGWLIAIAIGLVGILLVIYFVLAPRNLWFTFVEEGKAKVVVRGSTSVKEKTPEGKVLKITKGGQFRRVLIQWKGYTFDKRWNVIKGKERHLLGGLRFFGFWPLDQIYTYTFQWSGVTEGGEIQHHPKEKLDYILLKDDVYWAKVEDAEDIDLLPLDVEVILTLRVANPNKALFAVQNWIETIVNRTKPAVRDSMTLDSFREMIKDPKAIEEAVYTRLKERGLLAEFRNRYGIDFRQCEVKKINPMEKFREETLKKWLGQREAEARATATVGTLIEMVAEETGMSREEIQKELKEKPKEFVGKYEKVWERNWDLIYRRMAIDGGSFLDVRVAGAAGIERMILNALALWKRTPSGKSSEKEKKTEGSEGPFH
jgi:hypothetical protein